MVEFDDLSYGDETRRYADYVGVPHDEANDTAAPEEGQAVTINGGNAQVAGSGEPIVGVAYTYRYTGDSGGPADPGDRQQDAPLTVKTSGSVKAETVDATVSAGDLLEIDSVGPTPGVFTSGADAENARAIALSDSKQDDRPDGTTAYYADVLLL